MSDRHPQLGGHEGAGERRVDIAVRPAPMGRPQEDRLEPSMIRPVRSAGCRSDFQVAVRRRQLERGRTRRSSTIVMLAGVHEDLPSPAGRAARGPAPLS